MAIFADVTLPGGMTVCKVYISPKYVSANRGAGHYALDYMLGKAGAELPIPPEFSVIEFKGGLRFSEGVIYDRNQPAHSQVYADLKAKALGGQLPWLSNLTNEDGSPFVPPAVPAVPDPLASLEAVREKLNGRPDTPDLQVQEYGVGEADDLVSDDVAKAEADRMVQNLLDGFDVGDEIKGYSAARCEQLTGELYKKKAKKRRARMSGEPPDDEEKAIDQLIGLLAKRGV